MQKTLIFLSGCAMQAFAAEPLLRFQGVSETVFADAPGPAAPTVDPATQTAGLPVKQKLNIGEKTPLSPAMQAVLCLVVLYYSAMLITFVVGLKKELASIPFANETDEEKKLREAQDTPNEMQKQLNRLQLIVDDAKGTIDLIPMVSILIVFARMRAKVDLEGTNPPDYARKAFFGIVGVMYTQAFFGLIFNILQNVMGDSTMLTKFKAAMKLLLTFGLYTCIVVIFHSIFTLTKTASE